MARDCTYRLPFFCVTRAKVMESVTMLAVSLILLVRLKQPVKFCGSRGSNYFVLKLFSGTVTKQFKWLILVKMLIPGTLSTLPTQSTTIARVATSSVSLRAAPLL